MRFKFQFPLVTSMLIISTAQSHARQVLSFDAAAFPVTNGNGPMVTADFDLDGCMDVFVGSTGAIRVVRGDGSGRWVSQLVSPTSSNPAFFIRVASADMDHDGDRDVVYPGISALQYAQNNGTGVFTIQPISNPGSGSVNGIDLGDVTGDGLADCVISNNINTLQVLRNTGNGALTLHSSVTLSGGTEELGLADLDADGDLDAVITQGFANRFAIRKNDGAGFFPTQTSTILPGAPSDLVIADVDLDGYEDAVAGNTSGTGIFVAFGNGVGSFTATTSVPGPTPCSLVAVTTLDGNALPSIVGHSVAGISQRTVFAQGQHRSFSLHSTRHTEPTQIIAGADVNGDWFDDLISWSEYGLWANMADGVGGLVDCDSYVLLNQLAEYRIASVDVDGDSIVDLVCNRQKASAGLVAELVVWKGLSDGTFVLQQSLGLTLGQPISAIPTGDFNGDGFGDCVLQFGNSTNGGVQIAFGTAGCQLLPPVPVTTGAPGGVGKLRVADVNADGFDDIVTADFTSIYTILGSTSGVMSTPVVNLSATMSYLDIDLVDCDGDGFVDVVAASKHTSATQRPVLFLKGAGTGSFTQVAVHPFTSSWPTTIRATDLDADGWTDLLVGGEVPKSLWIMYGAGPGTFAPPIPLSLSVPVSATGIEPQLADVDADGLWDLVFPGVGLIVVPQTSPRIYTAAQYMAVTTGVNLTVLASPTSSRPYIAAARGYRVEIYQNRCRALTRRYGYGCIGHDGMAPDLALRGCAESSGIVELSIRNGAANAPGLLLFGGGDASISVVSSCAASIAPLFGFVLPIGLSPGGSIDFSAPVPSAASGTPIHLQFACADPLAADGVALSNAIQLIAADP